MFLRNSNIYKLIRNKKKKVIFTRRRGLVLDESSLGKIFYIYNGKRYLTKIRVENYLLDRKLGEFCSTRILHVFKRKKKHGKKK